MIFLTLTKLIDNFMTKTLTKDQWNIKIGKLKTKRQHKTAFSSRLLDRDCS